MTAREKLKLRMSELGHEAKKSMGQNFLVSDSVIEKILNQAKQNCENGIIEIGPGLGALTDELRTFSNQFEAIEFDRSLCRYWVEKGLKVYEADALKFDWSIVQQKTLVSNLPYQIAASLVIELSLVPSTIDVMILMFQKEVAHKINCPVTDSEYGFLSVVAQIFWTIKKVCDAGPQDFLPAPKIASRVLFFTRKTTDIPQNPKKFIAFAKSLFQNRRRQLKSILKGLFSEKEMLAIKDYFNSIGKLETLRSEELSPKEFLNFYNFCQELKK